MAARDSKRGSLVNTAPPEIAGITLRNVACDACDGSANSTLLFTGSRKIESYSHCKTQVKKLEVYKTILTDEGINEKTKVNIDVKSIISGKFKMEERWGGEELEFSVEKKSGLWTCVWPKSKGVTFPCKCELMVTIPGKKKDTTDTTPWYTAQLVDPELPPKAGCCTLQ